MSDYSGLSDDTLNRLVAERRGWTVRKVTWTPASSLDRGWCWILFNPDVKQAMHGSADYDDAWHIPSNEPPGREVYLPHVATDPSAALELLKEMRQDWVTLSYTFSSGEAIVNWPVKGIDVVRDVPARAISEAWLHWTDAHPTSFMLAAPPVTSTRHDAQEGD